MKGCYSYLNKFLGNSNVVLELLWDVWYWRYLWQHCHPVLLNLGETVVWFVEVSIVRITET